MTPRYWLASYPKSGNTWLRMMIGALFHTGDSVPDINALPDTAGIASDRVLFDEATLLESGVMHPAEIAALRPRVHERRGGPDDAARVQFIKVHDAYTLTASGEPLLAGARGADGAIVIVRDPRDVASSFANHSATSVDAAIARMNDPAAAMASRSGGQNPQLLQTLLGWSDHIASWLDQTDIPVHLVRYEAMRADPAREFQAAMAFAGIAVDDATLDRVVAATAFARLQRQEAATGFREASGARKDRVFFRRGKAGGWSDELTPAQIAQIEADHLQMMQRLGYAPAFAKSDPRA